MPLVNDHNYQPPAWLRNGHLNTIYPYLFRKNKFNFQKEIKFETEDDDFFFIESHSGNHARCVLINHGLEGSSESQYVLATSELFAENDFDVLAINFRGCKHGMNNKAISYNSGFTRDLHAVINSVKDQYDELFLVGFSLGGNMILKYANDGIYELSPKIKAIVTISVPIDLHNSCLQIDSGFNQIYAKNFLKSLKKNIKKKGQRFPEKIDLSNLEKVNSLVDFDNYFTAPIHGYIDAADYYQHCHAKQFLHNVSLPTLLLNALDDPFLSPTCYPTELAENSEHLHFLAPNFGGHVGFVTFGQNFYWDEIQALHFVNRYSSYSSN